MWKWLQVWLALFLGVITALVIYFAITFIVAHGEPPFTRDQKGQLMEEYPGGTFIDDHTYKWCAGQAWWIADPRGNWSSIGGSCIRWKQ